ncbi:MAG: hypothetical protein HY996_07715 [Micrococcales bacterium]|nr:hypothetical protein [Micrococcales bacterium]
MTIEAPIDELDAALRHFRRRSGYLQHVVALDLFGDLLVVDGRFGAMRREYRAVLDGAAPGRLSWHGPTTTGSLEWDATVDGRSTLALHLSWEPDSLAGLLIATVHLDQQMLRADLRRFADHVADSVRRASRESAFTRLAAPGFPAGSARRLGRAPTAASQRAGQMSRVERVLSPLRATMCAAIDRV